MPRGVRKEVNYTGEAAKINDKVKKLEEDLKAAKVELKAAYKKQLADEKKAAQKQKADNQKVILKALESSNVSAEEVLEFLKAKKSE